MRYLFSWCTTYIYSFLVVVGGLFPVKFRLQLLFSFQDKVIHALIYFLLVFLAGNTFLRKKVKNPKICSFFYAFSLGLLVEMTQYFLPFRSFEFWDILANFLGSSLGILVITGKPVENCS